MVRHEEHQVLFFLDPEKSHHEQGWLPQIHRLMDHFLHLPDGLGFALLTWQMGKIDHWQDAGVHVVMDHLESLASQRADRGAHDRLPLHQRIECP